MSIAFDKVDFTNNPEPRCPCVLLLDTSGSMSGAPIDDLNKGLQSFQGSLSGDSVAMLRVEVAIVTFGPVVSVARDFVTAGKFTPPILSANGGTPMGAAICLALDLLDARKNEYKQHGLSYYRPWVFLVTDGAPTDEWELAAQRVQAAEAGGKIAFFTVGVEAADMATLAKISPRAPMKLKGLDFQKMFLWLSASLASISRSKTTENVPLQTPLGWGEIACGK